MVAPIIVGAIILGALAALSPGGQKALSAVGTSAEAAGTLAEGVSEAATETASAAAEAVKASTAYYIETTTPEFDPETGEPSPVLALKKILATEFNQLALITLFSTSLTKLASELVKNPETVRLILEFLDGGDRLTPRPNQVFLPNNFRPGVMS